MVEKKQIVYDLNLSYNGPLLIEEFYAEVEKWMSEKGLHKELKRKSEEVEPKEKKIEWVIEAWNEPEKLVKLMVRLRVMFNHVKIHRIKRKGRNIRINQADVLITIDGFIEAELSRQWTNKPIMVLIRTLYDKYIWNIGMSNIEKHEGTVNDNCYDLHKRLKAFFNLYKIKVS